MGFFNTVGKTAEDFLKEPSVAEYHKKDLKRFEDYINKKNEDDSWIKEVLASSPFEIHKGHKHKFPWKDGLLYFDALIAQCCYIINYYNFDEIKHLVIHIRTPPLDKYSHGYSAITLNFLKHLQTTTDIVTHTNFTDINIRNYPRDIGPSFCCLDWLSQHHINYVNYDLSNQNTMQSVAMQQQQGTAFYLDLDGGSFSINKFCNSSLFDFQKFKIIIAVEADLHSNIMSQMNFLYDLEDVNFQQIDPLTSIYDSRYNQLFYENSSKSRTISFNEAEIGVTYRVIT